MTDFKNAYPQDIKALTPLRFAASVWVLLYFFGDRLGLTWRDASGFIAKGYMGVDLFFILSGFILAHVYGPQVIGKRFNYGSFLWARLARLYPVHLVTLGALVVLALVATAVGLEVNEAFDFTTLWGQLLMVQAWGFVPAGGWNHPAWSISAEWLAYLIFPISFGVIGLLKRAPWAGVALAGAAFGGLFMLVPTLSQLGGANLTQLTQNGGALRIIPSFLMGVAVWRFGQTTLLRSNIAWAGAALSLAWIILAPSFGASDAVTWIGLVCLIFCLAETSKTGDGGLMAAPFALWLGEASYSLYMVHMPVDLVWFQVVGKVFQPAMGGMVALLLVLGAMMASMIGAAILYQFIERPARDWIRAHDPFKQNKSRLP
jgi:peptidoglycan/LPS O-acetylase OafA/YrhL